MDGGLGKEDMFDTILMADERFRGEGYKEGFDRGTQRGLQNGRRHGASHGTRLSSEINFYYGFAVTWKCLLQDRTDAKSRKRVKVLDTVLGLIENSNYDDPQSPKLQEDVEKLRSKFRQVCSLLNIPSDFKDYVKTSEGTSF